MSWAKLKYLIVDLIVKFWPFILAGIVVLFVMAQIDSCRQNNLKEKIDRIESNITEQNVLANVLSNQKTNVQSEVNNAENKSNQARNSANQSSRRDSSSFPSADAEHKFCSRFCNDSSCEIWRRSHACP